MVGNNQNYVPVLTSEAGLCLTSAEWQEIGISTASYYLDSLLLKPGIDLLKRIDGISQYVGWSGIIILNASRFVANKEGIFTLVSPYDGSKIKFGYLDLFTIINKLKPAAVILPKKAMFDFPELWTVLDDSITPYIAAEDLLKQGGQKPHGVYFNPENEATVDVMMEQLPEWSHLPRYVIGALSLKQINACRQLGVDYIESDYPAVSGLAGQVYCGPDVFDLTDVQVSMQFDLIDSHCHCPVCKQQFTQAYLHHLYHHTPLLCQRFLIQHNAFQVSNSA